MLEKVTHQFTHNGEQTIVKVGEMEGGKMGYIEIRIMEWKAPGIRLIPCRGDFLRMHDEGSV